MLGVDRLDMIKGIPHKLLAFEKFLNENPEWKDKVNLIQIAVPTRSDVPEYQRLASQVCESSVESTAVSVPSVPFPSSTWIARCSSLNSVLCMPLRT